MNGTALPAILFSFFQIIGRHVDTQDWEDSYPKWRRFAASLQTLNEKLQVCCMQL